MKFIFSFLLGLFLLMFPSMATAKVAVNKKETVIKQSKVCFADLATSIDTVGSIESTFVIEGYRRSSIRYFKATMPYITYLETNLYRRARDGLSCKNC